MDDLAARNGVKHAVLAVEDEQGSFRWAAARGNADPDGTPMGIDTPFNLASIDKLLTACVVLRLYEAGTLGLEQPIAAYLPRTLIDGIHRYRGVDYVDSIRVRHLLAHTSGLADCFEDPPRDGRSLLERLFLDGDRAWSRTELMEILRGRLTPRFAPQPLDAKRQRAHYSNSNYELLHAIIESVTGQTIAQAFEHHVFRPLQLTRTFVFGHTNPIESTPAPATIWCDDRPLVLPRALACFPCVYSTLSDSLTIMRAIARGRLFLRPETAAAMVQRWNRFGFSLRPAALRRPGWPIEYGLGIMRFRLPRLFAPINPVPAVIGHSGSIGSWLFHCPGLELYLAGTVDQTSAGAVPYRVVPPILRLFASAQSGKAA